MNEQDESHLLSRLETHEYIGKKPNISETRKIFQPVKKNLPGGWRQIDSAVVYEKDGKLRITAKPDDAYPGFEDNDDEHPHSCDSEGCGWEHVVGDGSLRRAKQ